MAITLGQLRTFLVVLRTGSVHAAADELMVTQPSVSAALAALSREIGAELWERDGRGIRPTAACEAFAPYAAHVIGLLDDGVRAAREAHRGLGRELRVAAVTTAAEHILPQLLLGFAAAHPDVRVSVDVGNREVVFARLAAHDADLAIAGRAPADAELRSEPFMENATVLVVAAGDRLAGRASVAPAELAGRTWLMREAGSGTRALNEATLARWGLEPRVLTLGSNGAIVGGVRTGLGVSIVSRIAAASELDAGVLAALPVPGLPERHWYVHRSRIGPERPLADAFAAHAAALGRPVGTGGA